MLNAGLLDNQWRIVPRTSTRHIAIVAPEGSDTLAEVSAELERWREAGVINTVAAFPTALTGAGAAIALTRTLIKLRALAVAGRIDAVLMVRGAETCGATVVNEGALRAFLEVPVPIFVVGDEARDGWALTHAAWRSAKTAEEAVEELWKLISVGALAALRAKQKRDGVDDPARCQPARAEDCTAHTELMALFRKFDMDEIERDPVDEWIAAASDMCNTMASDIEYIQSFGYVTVTRPDGSRVATLHEAQLEPEVQVNFVDGGMSARSRPAIQH
jgi:hypothetical protein